LKTAKNDEKRQRGCSHIGRPVAHVGHLHVVVPRLLPAATRTFSFFPAPNTGATFERIVSLMP
jgi:hypothetical protein